MSPQVPFDVTLLEAAQLSRLAYVNKSLLEFLQKALTRTDLSGMSEEQRKQLKCYTELLPRGWECAPRLSSYGSDIDNEPDRNNQFITFVNHEKKQCVMAFKGSDNLHNLRSDLQNNGAAEWLSVRQNVATILGFRDGVVRDKQGQDPRYQQYAWSVTGHSLGGGLAQTCAVLHGMNGHVQNPLPIAATVIDTETWGEDLEPGTKGFESALRKWEDDKHKLSMTVVHGDIADLYYHQIGHCDFVFTHKQELPYRPNSPQGVFEYLLSWTPIGMVTRAIDAHRGGTVAEVIQSIESHGEHLDAPARKSTLLAQLRDAEAPTEPSQQVVPNRYIEGGLLKATRLPGAPPLGIHMSEFQKRPSLGTDIPQVASPTEEHAPDMYRPERRKRSGSRL